MGRITFEIHQQAVGAKKRATQNLAVRGLFGDLTLRRRHKESIYAVNHCSNGFMAGTTGLEPATSAVTGQRSNQLSYVPRACSGMPRRL